MLPSFEIDDVVFLICMTGGYATMMALGVDPVTIRTYVVFCLIFWVVACDSENFK